MCTAHVLCGTFTHTKTNVCVCVLYGHALPYSVVHLRAARSYHVTHVCMPQPYHVAHAHIPTLPCGTCTIYIEHEPFHVTHICVAQT